MNEFMKSQKKVANSVVSGFQKVEDTVVSGYQKVENFFVDGYQKIENSFVKVFLTPKEIPCSSEDQLDSAQFLQNKGGR